MSGGEAAEALEALLGDAADDMNPYGFAACTARDERDEFPTELTAALRGVDFHLNYLPSHLGGTFAGFAESLTLVRTAARRDMAVMPATMFSLTAVTCLLLHGSTEQQRWAARLIRSGASIGFALSEADHGSDLLANTVRLRPGAGGSGGMTLDGRKWMVGRGHTCDGVYVVARSGERGPGAFTSVLVDLTDPALAPHVSRGVPVRATGMRGIDFAHLDFTGCPVDPGQVVGLPGQGLEAAVKAQQIVRVMSTAGSLGCADTALRVTLDFAVHRALGRKSLIEVGHPRRDLAVAAAALLAADATALAAARGLHVMPETFSVWGCAAKHVVAEATADLMARCAGVLSTRAVLREEGPGGGIFQKVARDAALVRVVDTSPVANLRSFASQLPAIAGRMGAVGADSDHDVLRAVFSPEADRPEFAPHRLDLNARGREPVTAHARRLAAGIAEGTMATGLPEQALRMVSRLARRLADLPSLITTATGTGEELTDLAEHFAWLHAASCCLWQWWHSCGAPQRGNGFDGTDWLAATLAYTLCRADGIDPRREHRILLPALESVLAMRRDHRLFSAVPVRLARPTRSAQDDLGEMCPHSS